MSRDPLAACSDGWFAQRLELHGDRIAVVAEDGRQLSYSDLAGLADASAAAIATSKLAALEFSSSLASVTAYIGALRANIPIILLSPGAMESDHRIAERFQPDAIYSARGGWQIHPRSHALDHAHAKLAVMLSTSGSTGDPKLVRLSRENLEANAEAIVDYLGLKPTDRAITSLPLHYSFGLSVLHSHLAAGASIALTSQSVATDAFWSRFTDAGCTVLAGVPHSYRLLERSGFFDRDLPSLRLLQQAGGRMDPASVLKWSQWAAESGRNFFVMYGQTEATARMAYLPPQLAASNPDCIGLPIPGGSFSIEREDGTVIDGAGERGELIYWGPNVMMGYAQARSDLARAPDLPVLRTGDMAERNEAGLFKIVGRAARFVKLFGLRLGLDDIERMLTDEGFDAAVTGDDEHIVVAIGQSVDADALRRRLADHYRLPLAAFEILEGSAIPRRENGKPDYPAIFVLAAASRPKQEPAEGRGLYRIYASIARGRPISPQDSFASLGGDSLSYVQATIEIEEMLGHLPDGWENMPLAVIEDGAAEMGSAFPYPTAAPKLESEILLRACAITAIVLLHTHLARMAGGAELLIFLAGFNLLRFQRARLLDGRAFDVVRNFFLNFIAPYLVLLLLFFALKEEADIPSLFLVSNYVGRFGTVLEPYWFLEALFQCLIVTALLFSLPPVFQAARHRLIFVLMLLFAASIGLRLMSLGLEPASLKSRTAESVLFLFSGGLLFAAVRGLLGRSLVALALICMSATVWGITDTHPWWLIIALPTLIFLPRIPAPVPVRKLVQNVAAASFYIYIVHAMVIWLLVSFAGLRDGILPAVSSLCMGWLAWRAHMEWQFRRQSPLQ